jgi:hypothetical protein
VSVTLGMIGYGEVPVTPAHRFDDVLVSVKRP